MPKVEIHSVPRRARKGAEKARKRARISQINAEGFLLFVLSVLGVSVRDIFFGAFVVSFLLGFLS
jgi:hypothetical protein